MNYFDIDFFDYPSEFETQIDEFKQALSATVKKEFLDRMAALEKENAELRDYRDNKSRYDRELRNAKLHYDAEVARIEREAQRQNMKKYFGDNLFTAWRPLHKIIRYKKCNRCDDSRRLIFKDPVGREQKINCVCDDGSSFYSPKEVKLISFYVGESRVSSYYERFDEGCDFDRYEFAGDIYSGEDFEKVNWYRVVFFKKEDCESYCKWLNDRQKEKLDGKIKLYGLELDLE